MLLDDAGPIPDGGPWPSQPTWPSRRTDPPAPRRTIFAISNFTPPLDTPVQLVEMTYDGTILRTLEVPDSANIMHPRRDPSVFLRADAVGRLHLVTRPLGTDRWVRPGIHVRTYDLRTDTWASYDLDRLPTESVYEEEFAPTMDDEHLLWWGRAPMAIYENQTIALDSEGELVRAVESLWAGPAVGPDGWLYAARLDRDWDRPFDYWIVAALDPVDHQPIGQCFRRVYEGVDLWPGEENPPVPPPLHLLTEDNTFVTVRHRYREDGTREYGLEWWDICTYELVRRHVLELGHQVVDVGRDGWVMLQHPTLEGMTLILLGPDGEQYQSPPLSTTGVNDARATFVDRPTR